MGPAAVVLGTVLAPDTALGRWARDSYGAHVKSQVLGQGTFGVVFAGCRVADCMPVAIKVQRVDLEVLADELSCAQLMVDSPHRNVVARLETFLDPRQQIFASVSPQGLFDLRMMLHSRSSGGLTVLGAKLVQALSADLVHAVAHLHKLGVVHRDIKPANCVIYVSPASTELRLGDFGCSRVEDAGGMTPGLCTSWYRAPELFTASQLDHAAGDSHSAAKYTRAIDVWGVGCVVGEMLACVELFAESTDAGVWRLIRARLGDKLVKGGGKPVCVLADLRFPRSHTELEGPGKDLLLKCLQLEASERPAVADLCVHALVFQHGSVHRASEAGGVAPGAPAGAAARSGAGNLVADPVAPVAPAARSARQQPPLALGSQGGGEAAAAGADCACTGFCVNGKSNHPSGCKQATSPGSSYCSSCRCKAVGRRFRCAPGALECSSGSDTDPPGSEGPHTSKRASVEDSLGASRRTAPGERCFRSRKRGETCYAHVYAKFSIVLKACRRLGRIGLLQDLVPCDIEAFLAAGPIHDDLVLQFIGAWLKHPLAIAALSACRPQGSSYSPRDLMNCLHQVPGA